MDTTLILKSNRAPLADAPLPEVLPQAVSDSPGRGSKDPASESDFLAMRLLVLALLATTVAFAWTQFRSPPVPFTPSVLISLSLLTLCLASWISVTRAMFAWRRACVENTAVLAAKDRLVRERDLMRMIIDNLPDYLYAKDVEGRFVLNNSAHARAMGALSPRELVGKSDFNFFPRDLATQYRADEERILRSGQPLLNHEQIRTDRTGRTRWVAASKVVWRDGDGTILGIAGISRDIHEAKLAQQALRKSEQLYRTLVDNLPQRVFFKDQSLTLVSVNSAYARSLGRAPQDLLGRTDFDLFPRDIAEKNRTDDLRVMNARQPEVIEENRVTDGQRRILEMIRVPVVADDGQVIGLLGLVTDITDRKIDEEKLREFASQLERSNRELQDFAYVASHDLQEPLRKIVVFGDRLKEKTGTAFGAEPLDYLERMQKAAARMQTLINDLLTFSRVTTKARPFERVELSEVAREVVADLEGRLEQVHGRVEIGSLPAIDAEVLQIRQLLQNLIGNALKFRRLEEPPVVRVDAQLVFAPRPRSGPGAPPEALCQLTVSDNGIGFDEKYLDRIFNVFQRLHSRTEYEGTGMGLAIVKKIVLYHGGEVTARSAPGRGAMFIVTLPAVHPKEVHHD